MAYASALGTQCVDRMTAVVADKQLTICHIHRRAMSTLDGDAPTVVTGRKSASDINSGCMALEEVYFRTGCTCAVACPVSQEAVGPAKWTWTAA